MDIGRFGSCVHPERFNAAGMAIFKPAVWGSLPDGLSKANSSVGRSLFDQIVDLGVWLGPFPAHDQ